ncbi:MAG: hypothetical protein JNN18_22045 [Rubrivivax sp.]|nr:hypothetical protein [Rubrivivax sp.]
MQTRHLSSWLSGLAMAAALVGCGGGDAGPTRATVAAADPAASITAAADALADDAGTRRRALAAATAAAPAAMVVADPAAAAEQLLDHAEATFPGYFPGHPATASLPPFAYRYYAATGIYLGVVLDGGTSYTPGGVYVMGGDFGNAPRYVGQVTDFIVPNGSGFRAALPTDKAVVLQGAGTTLRVDVSRQAGWGGPVQLTLAGLPAGASAAAVSVPAGAAYAEIPITAGAAAPHSLPTTAELTVSALFGARTALAKQAVTVTVRGRPGVVDTSFGTPGAVPAPALPGAVITQVASSEDYAWAVAVQPDGKVLTVGTTAISTGTVVAVTRHLRDGGIDPSFGTGGKVITQVGTRGDSARAAAVQPDGRIVVAGWTDSTGIDANFLVLRYRADGTPDPTFADGGRYVHAFGTGTDRAHAVAIQDDGRIVVGGTTLKNTSTTGQDFALVRLMPNGALDTSFGDGGQVITPMQAQSAGDVVYALALPVVAGEQRIVAVGGEGNFVAARYRASGALDTTFGTGGKVIGLFDANIGAARSVALLPGGRMVLAGGILNDFAAAQLTESGQLDVTFGQAGRVIVPVSTTNWDNATAVARQPDGRLVLGGWAYSGNSSSADFVAVRLTAAGALDAEFGTNGIAIHPVAAGTRSDSARGLVLQHDDRVPAVRAILGGEASSSNYDYALVRLWL